ncbi:MAG: hypothetical protein R2825_16625 [Saprospiraceae bacterium]
MNKQFISLCFLLLFFIQTGISQEKTYPPIPLNGSVIHSFIPEGYYLLDTAWGDFNHDSEIDFALIIEGESLIIENRGDKIYPDSTEEFPRILIICFKTNTGFELVERSNSFILRKTEGGMFGDPYAGMNIDKKRYIGNRFLQWKQLAVELSI